MALWLTMPTATLSGYPADNIIAWQTSYNGDIRAAGAANDPNDDANWTDDASLTYAGVTSGFNTLWTFATYSYAASISTGFWKKVTLELNHNPFRIPELDRDFMYANNGAAAVSSAGGNAKVAGFEITTEDRYYGDSDSIPSGYTQGEPAVGLLGGPPHWTYAYKITTDIVDSVVISLLGATPDGAGGWIHEFLHQQSAGTSLKSEELAPYTFTDLFKAYMDNSGGQCLFEWMTVDPHTLDLASDSSPGKFKSMLDSMLNESITWQWKQLSDSSWQWLPYGTKTMKTHKWSGISVASSFIKYSGDFSLFDQDHVPPLALPEMD